MVEDAVIHGTTEDGQVTQRAIFKRMRGPG